MKRNLEIAAENTFEANNYFISVDRGNVEGQSIINKFGRNGLVTTSLVPVCVGGNYRTPITATILEIVSSSVLDTSAGTGARTVFVQGLDANFDLQSETVVMNGTAAAALAKSYVRVFRIYVETSGTYATQLTGSHFGELTLRETGAGQEWAKITLIGAFGIGQSQIGAYTIPRGYTGHLLSKHITIETNKTSSLYLFKRENANDITTPFTGSMRLFEENDGLATPFSVNSKAPLQKLNEMTDIGFLAKTSVGTASISVDFQILLIKN